MNIKDPVSYADPNQGQIKHIDFKLRLDFESQTIHGRADYAMMAPVSGPLYLDTRDLQIERVRAGGVDLAWEIDREDEILGQRLHISGLDGNETFTIEYRTGPGARALQWVPPEQTAGRTYPYMYSQCQTIQARSLFACQDTPAVRITYAAQVTVPSALTAVMAAAPVGVEEAGGERTFRFEMPQAIPSYLFALAAGNLAAKEIGPRSRIYAEPETIEAAAWEFEGIEANLAAAEGLFGEYPWERYDLLVMPPSFPYGGMENPRLTFLTPTVIAGDRSLTSVIAHELAHSWTGNLVTNATWDDFWLNEGWTTWAERRILEAIHGHDHAQMAAVIGVNNLRANLDEGVIPTEFTKLQTEGFNGEDVTWVPYEKGFLFLTAIERLVGREAFDEFALEYIREYAFQSITTGQFLDYLKEHLPGAFDGLDVEAWMGDTGFPEGAPEFSSAYLEAVDAALGTYKDSEALPVQEMVGAWSVDQRRIFLQGLPLEVPLEHCAAIEKLFGLDESRNVQLLTAFYLLSIRSGYREVMAGVEALLAEVGRGLFVQPLYRTLAGVEWGGKQARAFFERYGERYHPIVRKAVEGILEKTGV